MLRSEIFVILGTLQTLMNTCLGLALNFPQNHPTTRLAHINHCHLYFGFHLLVVLLSPKLKIDLCSHCLKSANHYQSLMSSEVPFPPYLSGHTHPAARCMIHGRSLLAKRIHRSSITLPHVALASNYLSFLYSSLLI